MSRDLPDPPEYSLAGINYQLDRLASILEKAVEQGELGRIADALEAPARPKMCGEMHNAAGKPCVLDDRHVGHHASADGRLHWLDDE